MATTPSTPFAARLLAPAAPSRASFPTLRPPSLCLSRSAAGRGRLARAASKGAADNKGQEQEQEASTTAVDGAAATGTEEAGKEAVGGGEKNPEAVAAELKEVLRARKEAEAAAGGGGWWAGVAQEMLEIEWPAPGKVVGTTGVVLGVIAGSTAALLSVNALLAELSDRVFAGRGLQDFF
ncbi:hypothetical protein E2562_003761 [Oryza meyeriana var. granulata]|uniref:Uncharacterized protein n=1 Tax=Oryza meyeriana var. granulata TaxID=110450 RepID=A0A6G1BRQ4_9ORYZ|nr:hypothetical protein E2562_003761 [Oryza meyeriana var. granulata]